MPYLLPEDVAEEAQRLTTDSIVKLYILDATDIGGEIFRFCSSIDTEYELDELTSVGVIATAVTPRAHLLATGDYVTIRYADQEPYNGTFQITVTDDYEFTYEMASIPTSSTATPTYIVAQRLNKIMKFDGEEYVPVPVAVTGFEYNGEGPLPLPKVQISNVNKVLQASIRDLKDLKGAKFIRIKTFRQFLDDGDSPDPESIFPTEVYRVSRKTTHNRLLIEFELASSIDQESAMIPARQCIKVACTHRYRKWNAATSTFDYTNATCPYSGSTYFKNTDESTADPSLDRCSKFLSGCKLRFGTAPLPTRAFPGIGG